ncbi:hypothetical protein [Pseudomonas sp. GW101-3H06]|uniref:hypothetical protein n=1 Tax=Pseudomonas sp. GW101-3H06 TaxID=2751347 RepID=UPI001A92280A|nr:hypothetical protein [Pseudomonas sp. GW101-3H06]
MRVNVIKGDRCTGKTTQLQAIQEELKAQGIEVPIIIGERFTTPYFLNLISDQVLAGATHFLADDCTQFQIKAVQDLVAQGRNARLPITFIAHLVRQA